MRYNGKMAFIHTNSHREELQLKESIHTEVEAALEFGATGSEIHKMKQQIGRKK